MTVLVLPLFCLALVADRSIENPAANRDADILVAALAEFAPLPVGRKIVCNTSQHSLQHISQKKTKRDSAFLLCVYGDTFYAVREDKQSVFTESYEWYTE